MATIRGKVLNSVKWQEKFPEVTIYISDSEGKIVEPKNYTKTDEYGEYELSIDSSVFKNGFISVKPQFGLVQETLVKAIKSKSIIDFDLAESEGISEQEEVVVVVEKPNRLKCKEEGGVWDGGTQTCIMPSIGDSEKKPKLKTWEIVSIAGGSFLVLLLIGVIVYDSSRNK